MEKSEFITRYQSIGGDAPEIQIKPVIRINSLRAPNDILSRLSKKGIVLHKIPYLVDGYEVVSSKFSLGSTPEHLLGYFYMQSAPAQLPAQLLGVTPTSTVLDACASPGGKTTQLAALMDNKGVIVALEKKSFRLGRLKNNLERLGTHNTLVYGLDANEVGTLSMQFDHILVDAPCGGNYTHQPDWFTKRTLDDINRSSEFQRSILASVYHVLKPGGTMIYSTCSLEPEENEFVIDHFLTNHPGAQLQPIELSIGEKSKTTIFERKLNPSITHCVRLWPGKTNTEGFFIAKIHKPQGGA